MYVAIISCSKEQEDIIYNGTSNDNTQSEEVARVLDEINQVSEKMSKVFLEANTAEEMSEHIDEINALEHVKIAWAESDAVFAMLKSGHTMFWYFPPEEEGKIMEKRPLPISRLDSLADVFSATRSQGNPPTIASNMKVCIINQTSNDESKEYIADYFSQAAQTFKNYGYQVKEVNGDDFTLKFIKDSIANYNVVVLVTHGKFASQCPLPEFHEKHWILTGSTIENIESADFLDKDVIIRLHKENCIIKSGKRSPVWVSEDWLEKNVGRFPDQSMLFSTVCHSLEYNENVYEALRGHNLGCYFGYDEEVPCRFSLNTFDMLASLMVLGTTAVGSYDLLDLMYRETDYIKEKDNRKVHVNLKLCTRTDDYDMSICDAVDMGLSVMWGTRNLGSLSSCQLGDFYTWGDVEIGDKNKEYKFWEDEDHTAAKYIGDEISGNSLYDPATKLLGKPWRLPTKAECDELVNNCIIYNVANQEMVGMNNWVSGSWGGALMVSKNKNACIYLPYYWNSKGSYWTGTLVPDNERSGLWSDIPYYEAYCLWVHSPGETGTEGKVTTTTERRVYFSSIRPVYAPE